MKMENFILNFWRRFKPMSVAQWGHFVKSIHTGVDASRGSSCGYEKDQLTCFASVHLGVEDCIDPQIWRRRRPMSRIKLVIGVMTIKSRKLFSLVDDIHESDTRFHVLSQFFMSTTQPLWHQVDDKCGERNASCTYSSRGDACELHLFSLGQKTEEAIHGKR